MVLGEVRHSNRSTIVAQHTLNNPVAYADPNGEIPVIWPWDSSCKSFCEQAAREWPARNKEKGAKCYLTDQYGVRDEEPTTDGDWWSSKLSFCVCGGMWVKPAGLLTKTGFWYTIGTPKY